MPEQAGWAWLETPTSADSALAAMPEADPAPSFARCFTGTDGARVLAVLRAMTLDRALGPDAPEAALRHLEGQRQLVATVLALIARGRAG
ncbi:Bbp19 family protein [Azospirillum endophyticum]